MKRTMAFLLTVTVIWATASSGLAQDANRGAKSPSDKPAAEKKAAKATELTPVQLRAKIHRTMAALIEAQSAEKPDQATIDKLTRRLTKLRQQMWTQGPGPQAGYGPRRAGPGAGYRRDGRGAGMGAGWQRGPGYGRGAGMGAGWQRGPGYGRGSGWQRGPGYGRGSGMGSGMGLGTGPGFGRRMGWWFVDADGDGICDNFPTPTPKPAPKK